MKCGRARGELPAPPADSAPGTPPPPPHAPAPSVPAPHAPPPPPALPGAPAGPMGSPPPAYVPAPAGPSPVGAFLGRAFRGGWAASAQAALWPVGMLLIASAAIAIPSYGQEDEVVVSFTDRFRLVTALLLQGLGGGFEVSGPGEDSNSFGSGGDSGLFEGGGGDSGTASLSMVPLTFTALWIVALLIGVRMLRARQAFAPRTSRTAGLEAAVRIALLTCGAVLVLALFAAPTIDGVEVSSAPLLSALGALGLSLATAAALLHRDDLAQWLAVRPGVQAFVRAGATALRALAVVLALGALVAYLCLAAQEDMEKEGLLVLLAFLPNLGAAAVGLGWGGALEFSARGSSGFSGGTESETVDLSELADLTNDWALVGGLALGAVCALTVGVLAARRHAGRGEQVLVAGLFFGALLVVGAVSGLAVEGSSSEIAELSGEGSFEAGLSIPEMLLFGLLWLSAATFLGPYVLRMTGNGSVPPAPYAPPTPLYAPPATGAPAAHPVYELGVLGSPAADQDVPDTARPPGQDARAGQDERVPGQDGPVPGLDGQVPGQNGPVLGQDGQAANPQGQAPNPQGQAPHPQGAPPAGPYTPFAAQPTQVPSAPEALHSHGYGYPPPAPNPAGPAPQRSRVTLWIVTLTAALALGGGATAGFLLLQNEDGGGPGTDDAKPSAPASPSPSAEPPTTEPPTTDPVPSETPATDASGSPTAGTDSRIVTDPAGFSFAVPDVFSRVGEENGQITYAGSTGFGHFLIGVVPDAAVSSYENFRTIEKKSQSQPDYQRVRLEENTFRGLPGAIWEYTYTEKETGRTVHAIDQGYVAEDGTEYAIYFTDYEENWELGGQEIFDEALATWRLTN